MKKVYNVWHGTANGGLYLKDAFATRKEKYTHGNRKKEN